MSDGPATAPAAALPGSSPPPGGPLPSGIRLSSERRVRRFGGTERALHTVHGTAFLGMLGTGFLLGLPCLAKVYGEQHRPLVLDAHLIITAAWITGIALVLLLGDRRALRRTRAQFESLDADDLRWLRSRSAREAPQGRFNGGQKLHAVVQASATLLLFVSGAALWLDLRFAAFSLPGALGLHDYAMAAAAFFVVGHVGMALSPRIRASLPSIVRGTVPASYAREHHAGWDPALEPREVRPARTPARLVAAGGVLALGVAAAAVLTSV